MHSRHFSDARGILRSLLAASLLAIGGCSSLPPGSGFARTPGAALEHPEATRLGGLFLDRVRAEGGKSGFRIIPAGSDGFHIRLQMIRAAERTIDLQYFIFHGDDTGRQLTTAILEAADRGVRVRVLIDDAETQEGDEPIARLAFHPSIELRVFNPLRYRGHWTFLRTVEFVLEASRLDYRMHNKLLVVDNAVALLGGRNIGDEYFQVNPEAQFADDDVLAVGPVVPQLSATFDEYWRSKLAIPARALAQEPSSPAGEPPLRGDSQADPLAGILSRRLPLFWARAQVICDSPEKRDTEEGRQVGRLMQRPLLARMRATRDELILVTPYLVPGAEGMELLHELRAQKVRLRILTNSLESSTELLAQAVYSRYRVPLLLDGVELSEIRSLLGNSRGSGQGAAMSRFGNYSLHAKMFVFDRESIFLGSMNFDERSLHLNTEVGLIIESPELARQVAGRFEAMIQEENAYTLRLRSGRTAGESDLAWRTLEGGRPFETGTEPARSAWQRLLSRLLSILPVDDEL